MTLPPAEIIQREPRGRFSRDFIGGFVTGLLAFGWLAAVGHGVAIVVGGR